MSAHRTLTLAPIACEGCLFRKVARQLSLLTGPDERTSASWKVVKPPESGFLPGGHVAIRISCELGGMLPLAPAWA